MPFISREDGERFIIPSYRDILAAKKNSILKREIVLLSQNYGEYITFQRKNAEQVEVAFSSESGYLLGECVWYEFKRPADMIYCEAIPDTNDAILVIVKSGSVYLDGSFPLDAIADELVIFKSQQNNFSIFIHGNVPISEQPEEGKISFDANQVEAFTQLEDRVFPTLPGIKAFQLQTVDVVLKQNNIGTIPIKALLVVLGIPVILWIIWSYMNSLPSASVPTTSFIFKADDPYEGYKALLTTPDPTIELTALVSKMNVFFEAPGWVPTTFDYMAGNPGTLSSQMISKGAQVKVLLEWAKMQNFMVEIKQSGFYISAKIFPGNRKYLNTISSSQEVLATIVDRVAYVMPGNSIRISAMMPTKAYTTMDMGIDISSSPPTLLITIGNVLSNLPISLTKVTLNVTNGNVAGSINFKALGN